MENVFLWAAENVEILGAAVGTISVIAAGFIPNKYLSYIRIAKRIYDRTKKSIADAKQKKEEKE